jgi:hypothetical protein
MRIVRLLAWLALSLVLPLGASSNSASAADGGPGPGKPLWPKKGQLDKHLWTKAMSIQSRMWQHLSPEGLLIVRHRRDAGPAELSHDALDMADAAMWTGCYAASQACRWSVTRDPDALAQVRHLAAGMEALQQVTGVTGRFARNVGVPQTATPGEKSRPSPTGSGKWMRDDTSRDQLVGMTVGWYFIGRFMEDAALKALAAKQLGDISRRLHADGMWIRDHTGGKTKHGELRADVQFLPMIKNGTLASIGYATACAAAHLNPTDAHLQEIVADLGRRGFDDAVANQFTFVQGRVTSPNVNMVAISLMVLALTPNARTKLGIWIGKGMRAIRHATVGWWNAGICSCFLLSGAISPSTPQLLGEIRATLHAMPEREEPRILVEQYRARKVAPIWQRQPSSWYWTNDVAWFHIWKPGGTLGGVYWTGADWLFAYWLARAAGALVPVVGPGKEPTKHPCVMDYPTWMAPPAAGISSGSSGAGRAR